MGKMHFNEKATETSVLLSAHSKLTDIAFTATMSRQRLEDLPNGKTETQVLEVSLDSIEIDLAWLREQVIPWLKRHDKKGK